MTPKIRARDAAMPRRRQIGSQTIGGAKKWFEGRRICQRYRGRLDFDEKSEAYANVRGRLIHQKARMLQWSRPKHLKNSIQREEDELTVSSVRYSGALLSGKRNQKNINQRWTFAITEEKLVEVCRRIRDTKTLGLDTVPNRALTLAVKTRHDWFTTSFQARTVECFPRSVEEAKTNLATEN